MLTRLPRWVEVGAFLLAFLAVPVGIVVAVSFWDYNDWEVIPDFVTFNYVELFTSRLTYIL